jgi:hypothetical protein
MNATPDKLTESRVAAGIKTAALVVLLGLIAVIAQPTRMPEQVFGQPDASAPAPVTVGDTQYFPAQYPAPTAVAEQPPTF